MNDEDRHTSEPSTDETADSTAGPVTADSVADGGASADDATADLDASPADTSAEEPESPDSKAEGPAGTRDSGDDRESAADRDARDGEAASVEFNELQGNGEDGAASLEMLYDLTLPVSIELGRAEMTVEEVLELGRGSVIQLERLAGEPIDVYVGDRRLAEGEVVVVGEYFGVRITRILSPTPDLEGVAEEQAEP